MRNIYTSIDIGTEEIKILVMEYYNDKYNVLASSKVPSFGVKQGLIVDASLISNAIKKGIRNAESKLGTKIEQIIAVVPSNNIDITIGNASVDIKTLDNIITGDYIFNCMQKCLKGNIESTREVVGVFPIEYVIDKNKKVINPLGLEGKTLSMKSIIASVPKKNVYSVVSVIESLGIEVVDVLISSVGNYYSIKSKELDSKVVAMVDIGKDKTVLSVFNKGIIIKDSINLLGSNMILNDISFNYKTDEETTKKILEEFAVSNRKYADNDETVNFNNRLGEKIEINQYKLAEIIEYRIVELLKNIKNELNNLTNKEIGYIIITGGITSMLGFNAIVEELFSKNVIVLTTGIIGIRDNKYSTCYGSIKYFVEKLELREKEWTMFPEEKVEELIANGKKMGKSSVLGKIFDRIFD